MDWASILECLKTFGIRILDWLLVIVGFVVTPFTEMLYPPIDPFVPERETPPAVVQKHSIADYAIVYAPDAIAAEVTAANVLAETLTQITGRTYTAQEGEATAAKEFLIGAASTLSVADLGAEGYRIAQVGEDISITGGQPRGTLYGVYRFLEEYFDCHWYTSTLKVIPEGAAEIADVKEECYVPPLDYRETDWISPRDLTYSVANGLNSSVYRTLPAELGGNVGYNGSFAHTIINQFIKPADFFEAHPEWYAFRRSKNARVPNQLCLTNPQVLEKMIEQVRDYCANGNGMQIISVTQADNGDYCECANCKAVDAAEGSHAGTMLRFVNAIAADIAADYPEVVIDTFAYQYTRTAPVVTKPLPNVIVRLCSIECCFAHPLNDPDCPENTSFAKDIVDWSKICNRLYIWDYTTDYGHYNVIFSDFEVLQPNMQFFVENHVKGVYEEGNYTASECNSEFAELRAYLLSRLMFNPNLDYDAEMNGFLKAYYGAGWQYMREFIDFVGENAGTPSLIGTHRKVGIGVQPTDKALLDLKPNQIAYADALWEKAIALADSETRKQNVLRSQLSWRFWKGCNQVAEFGWTLPTAERMAANEALYNDFKAFGITRYCEGGENAMLTENPNFFNPPSTWRNN
ncbi:MAG: DUF4838 domain-containing protein [Oscillospiraceae bacterium]|jgi:hypothetical protein|nr:DUF4838 domain-containing protein [Oscillospiraceae bacterium]